MFLNIWDDLPEEMKNESVKKYYELLKNKYVTLFIKRIFDLVVACVLVIILLPLFVFICISIKLESNGPVFFRQSRITQNGRLFRIFKFRTMKHNLNDSGSLLTAKDDARITRVGSVLRPLRLDEIPQLFNIIKGDMTFVGTRPEVPKYVKSYSDEMLATLLLPAGVTSEASMYFRDESNMLAGSKNPDTAYINEILPIKMMYNLKSLKEVSVWRDINIMLLSIAVIVGINRYNPTLDVSKKDKSEIGM